jgi:hypothetical protein
VQYVEVIDEPEGAGTRRRVHARFGKLSGQFVERRLVHDEHRRMAFQIEEETFGLFRFLERIGSIMELEPAGPGQTRLVWSFFHQPAASSDGSCTGRSSCASSAGTAGARSRR